MQRRGFFKSLLGLGVAAKVAPEIAKAVPAAPVPLPKPPYLGDGPLLPEVPTPGLGDWVVTDSTHPLIGFGTCSVFCPRPLSPVTILRPDVQVHETHYVVGSELRALKRRS